MNNTVVENRVADMLYSFSRTIVLYGVLDINFYTEKAARLK